MGNSYTNWNVFLVFSRAHLARPQRGGFLAENIRQLAVRAGTQASELNPFLES